MAIEKPIGYSVNTEVKNKPPSGDPMEFKLGSGWMFKRWAEPKHLIEDVQAGYAVAPGWFTAGEKITANFRESQYWMLDFDKDISTPFSELHNHEWFSKNALFAYTTASYDIRGSYRIVGAWNKPIRSEEEFRAAGRYLHTLFPECDEAMERPAQCCYGNDGAQLITWDFTNRTELQFKERTPRHIKTGQDAFADIVRDLDSDSEELKIAKIKLCLQYIPERGEPNNSNTYNNAWKTVCAVTHELGSEKALQVFDECGWHGQWDLEHKVHDAETSRRGDVLGIGSLVELVRQIVTGDELADFNSQLDRINGLKRINRESSSNGEVSPVDQINACLEQMMNVLFDLGDPSWWAKAQVLEAQLRTLGCNRGDIKKRRMEMVAARLGLDLAGVKTSSNPVISLKDAKAKSQEWLLPGFLPKYKSSMFFGDSGAGKTQASLHVVDAYLKGKAFMDSVYPASDDGRNALFVASDGQGDALDHLLSYIADAGFDDDPKWRERFDIYAANEDQGTAAFNFSERSLITLHDRLKSGNYGLVVIDSLKACCMNSDYSIDDRSARDPMILLQSMCAQYKATLLWVHHTNKSSSKTSHRAGGSTDLVEIISAAHELTYELLDNGQTKSTWYVHKLRGSQKRRFEYSFDFEDGFTLLEDDVSTPDVGDQIVRVLFESPNKRMSRSEIIDKIGLAGSTLSNHAAFLKSAGFIQMRGRRWELTAKGTNHAKSLPAFNSKLFSPDF